MQKNTYEQKMIELKKGLSPDDILNSSNEDIRSCNFTVETIREYVLFELKEQRKKWNDLQIDILVQGVENSDWLKITFDTEDLTEEIGEWIILLEEEWEKSGEFSV